MGIVKIFWMTVCYAFTHKKWIISSQVPKAIHYSEFLWKRFRDLMVVG